MTEKRFEVHKFIEGFPVAVDLIGSYAKELVEQGKDLADVTISIHDNYRKQINGYGKNMTLKECCELLNELYEENQALKKENEEYQEFINDVMIIKDCFHCAYAQSNEDGINCYRKTKKRVKGIDTCEHYKKIGDV